jgi:hypothetical protein
LSEYPLSTRCDLTNDAVQLPSLWSSRYSRAVVIRYCRIERVLSMKVRTRIITGALITVVVLSRILGTINSKDFLSLSPRLFDQGLFESLPN